MVGNKSAVYACSNNLINFCIEIIINHNVIKDSAFVFSRIKIVECKNLQKVEKVRKGMVWETTIHRRYASPKKLENYRLIYERHKK